MQACKNYWVYKTIIHLSFKIIKKGFYFESPAVQFILQYFKRKKKKNDKWIASGDWLSVASAQHRKKRWLSYFKNYITFGFCLNWRVIFNLLHLCTWSLFSYSYKDPPNSLIWSECRNSSLSHRCYLWIFCSLIYLRKHPESLLKAIWCTSTIGSNSPSFIVCWILTKLLLSSHKYARMARGLVPPPQHSCL